MSPDTTLTTDLRSLFRDSEARAARLKLLIEVSRDLAAADGGDLDAAIERAARRAALFAGYGRGAILGAELDDPDGGLVIPMQTLAERGQPGVRLVFTAPLNPAALSGADDAEALRLLVEMIEARLTVDLQRRREADLLGRLAQREKDLEQVLASVVTAQEGERAAISADLHDGVAQQVAALHRRLELLRLDIGDGVRPEATDDLDTLIGMARQAVSDLRGVISGLRPTSLDDLGLAAALSEAARRLEDAGHAVTVIDRLPGRLPDWQETLLFRIGQEGLNNVAKHAPGAAVCLELTLTENRDTVVLSIEDAGGGPRVAHAEPSPRFGLEIMRERLTAVAGQLQAGPTARGFHIRASVPMAGMR